MTGDAGWKTPSKTSSFGLKFVAGPARILSPQDAGTAG
jgi:hypothetical protein